MYVEPLCIILTLCDVLSLWDVYEYQPISHSRCRLSTLYGNNYVMCDLIVWENTNVVHFSCVVWKYSTCLMRKYSPKGSYFIHWTSAVFSHIAFKWTPLAYPLYGKEPPRTFYVKSAMIWYYDCGEPLWPRRSVLSFRQPGIKFQIMCLEDGVNWFISPCPREVSWPGLA